jgi:hypothetical protein
MIMTYSGGRGHDGGGGESADEDGELHDHVCFQFVGLMWSIDWQLRV